MSYSSLSQCGAGCGCHGARREVSIARQRSAPSGGAAGFYDAVVDWFADLTGFSESAAGVREHLVVEGELLRSDVNGRETRCGTLTTPSLAELRQIVPDQNGPVTVREVVADARALHLNATNRGAMFQVASQFNLLEMPSPTVTPERGVTGYWSDRTQGPACAIACGAGTIQRNWFTPVGGQVGQSADRQIDCATDLAAALRERSGHDDLWEMRNGYLFATGDGLDSVADVVAECSTDDRDLLLGSLRIGLQSNTEVTFGTTSEAPGPIVNQAYCSAVPIGYSEHSAERWEPLARLVLDATYEATLRAAAVNAEATGNRSVFLTLVGGGVFGNPTTWIIEAIHRAVTHLVGANLDIAIVSYGSRQPEVADLITHG